MIELAKLIRSMRNEDEEVVITDRRIVLDRSMHLYGEMTFINCDFEIAEHSKPCFSLENDASVFFESCSFMGMLAKPADGSSMHQEVIRGTEESTLVFKNCRIENADSFIRSEGTVKLTECGIIYSGRAGIGDAAYKRAENSPFTHDLEDCARETIRMMEDLGCVVKNPVGALICRFINADGEGVEMTGCSIDCENNGDFSVKLLMEHGSLEDCILRGVYEVEADVLKNCTLENCITVNVQTENGENELTGCRLTGCFEIIAADAVVSDCEIIGLRGDFVSSGNAVTKCTFRSMTPDSDGAINISETQMNDCIFEDITLNNDDYLICADSVSSLCRCVFRKCRTTREDLQLVNAGACRSAFFRKKWIDADICSNCTGLDSVIHLEDWESVIGS